MSQSPFAHGVIVGIRALVPIGITMIAGTEIACSPQLRAGRWGWSPFNQIELGPPPHLRLNGKTKGLESMKCERCNQSATGYNLFDYCAKCSKNLCSKCMGGGCCDSVPAKSGMDLDNTEVPG